MSESHMLSRVDQPQVTLAELQLMSNEQVYRMWMDAEFPFDDAECGYCSTMHDVFCGTHCTSHKPLRMAMDGIDDDIARTSIKEHVELIWNARIKFKEFWNQ